MQGLRLNHRAENLARGGPTCSPSPDSVLHSLPSNLPIKCPDIWAPLHRMLRKISHRSQHGLESQVTWEDGRSAMKSSNRLGARRGLTQGSPLLRSSSVGTEPWQAW